MNANSIKKLMLAAKQEYEKSPSVDVQKQISRFNNIQMGKP